MGDESKEKPFDKKVQTFDWSCIRIQHFYPSHEHPDLSNIRHKINNCNHIFLEN